MDPVQMFRELLPRGLKKAIKRLEAEPERAWRLADLAEMCGVAPRTLQKHFRQNSPQETAAVSQHSV